MSTHTVDADASLGRYIIPLLKGVVYRDRDEKLFNAVVAHAAEITDYLHVMGVQLWLDEAEGYAFCKNADRDDDDPGPRLVARRPLTYDVSLMLALLRKRLAEHDTREGGTRLIVTRDDIASMVSVFTEDSPNEAGRVDKVEATINKIVDLGFLTGLRNQPNTYEVRRIIKAFIDAQWLHDFDAQLRAYVGQVDEDEEPATHD